MVATGEARGASGNPFGVHEILFSPSFPWVDTHGYRWIAPQGLKFMRRPRLTPVLLN